MLFESEFGLVVNVYYNSKTTTKKKSKKGNVINIVRKERKWNHRKCSIKTTEAEKESKTKIEKRTRAKNRKQ